MKVEGYRRSILATSLGRSGASGSRFGEKHAIVVESSGGFTRGEGLREELE
jgi:hypothetical protein